MNLNEWQERLSAHFAHLRDERADKGQHRTIYALEHGLDKSQLDDLSCQIHLFLENSRPAERHYLAWAVYAAEVGYRYSGDEYWDTFLELTPNWDNAYRNYIRDAYCEFHHVFKATRPRGRWAEHFKIICWPIGHAILPRDLQKELAQVLYDLRSSFDTDLLRDPEAFGKEIRDAAWNSGARFRKFVEDQLLVGQIATALLLSDEEKKHARVLTATLDRISKDLDQNRKSREWLTYARQRAHQVNIRGLLRETPRYETDEISSGSSSTLTLRDREVLELGLEPDLTLMKTAPNTWSVRLKADLTRFIRRFPALRETVANQRCTVAGTEPRVFLKGYFLFGDQEVTLARWPASDELLIKFEQAQPDLEYLLTAECLLRPGPIWLFKVSQDGLARHVKTGAVRPGASYVLVARTSDSFPATLNVTNVTLNCTGVRAVQFNVPDVVSRIYTEDLDSLHLHLSSGLELAPLSIPAAKWDDAGAAEWLSTDQPLVRVSADFAVDEILLNLVGPSPAKLELTKPVWPLFIDLGKLAPGVYELHVVFSRPGNEPLIPTFLQFTIRPARVWKGDRPAATPFAVHVSPAVPTLDELWEGQVAIELQGPQNQKADCEIRFLADGSVIHERKFGPVNLPCSAVQWSDVWQQITSDKDSENAFDASAECELTIRCELGRYIMRAARESKPLRWIVKQENSGYFLRFKQLDDRASVVFSRYQFRNPLEIGSLSEDAVSGFRVSEEGGLFVASTADETASVVVPPVIHSFKWLAADVVVSSPSHSESGLCQLVRALEIWHGARAIGNLFALRRKTAVVQALNEQTIRLLCGDEWLKYERLHANNRISVDDLANFISRGVIYGRIGSELRLKRGQLRSQTIPENAELISRVCRDYLDLPVFSTARDHGVSRQQWVTEFGYRMLSAPHSVRNWAQQDFVPAIGYLFRNSVLCRIIRFSLLLTDVKDRNQESLEAARV
ncbi:MAG TPA: hypothetical protein VJP02_10975 [Candidatus Sulfotelmatobacter sp.]|nr:hypothetical protein [Candidatus Sulfotelmatobacter sp.]